MKSLFLPLLVACSAVITAADNPSLTGKWQIHNSIVGNESDMTCTLTQNDTDLTGNCSSEQGTVNISGKVAEKKVTWVYKSEYNGGPITLTYKGIIDSATKISGSVTVEEYSVAGEFTATQSK